MITLGEILAEMANRALPTHVSEIRARKDHRAGVNLISDALPFGRLWYGEPNAASNAVDYAKFYSRSRYAGEFKEP